MKSGLVCLAVVLSAACVTAQEPTKTPAETLAAIEQLIAQSPPVPPRTLIIDYTALLQKILEAQQQLLSAQAQLILIEKNTNGQVAQINKTFGQTMARAGVWFGKYVAPAVVAYIAAKKL